MNEWEPAAPPTLDTLLQVSVMPFPVLPAIGVALALFYTVGAIRLWSTRRRWPIFRLVVFLGGCALIVLSTGTRVEDYGFALFSVFMFQQLTLMMAVPPLLVLGAPGRLLLRATPHRWLGGATLRAALRGLRSPVSRFVLHPGVTVPLFLLSFYGLYLGELADVALSTVWGHIMLEVFFLAAGVLFIVPVLSPDPQPRRYSHPAQLMDLLAEIALHAFFGVIVMMAARPLLSVFEHPPPSWGIDPLQDQQIAGALAWSYGELPTVLIALVILHRWFRADTRKAVAMDRSVDEVGNPQLDEYNAYLLRLDKKGRRP